MSKPKVIIADADEKYVLTFQLRFIEEYFNSIDIEVITSKEYFDSYFSSPRTIEILIVSEEFYTVQLLRHNISSLFVLKETKDEATYEENVNILDKYSNIKEIFYEIRGKSRGVLDNSANAPKETQIVLVTSATGGAGKTTVALGIAGSMSQIHKKVLYLNAARLQMFQYFMANATPISASDVYARLMNPTPNIYNEIKHVIRREDFSYLPPFKAAIVSLGISFAAYNMIVESAKASRDFDYIIVDVENAFDENTARLYDIADKVVVVTGQSLYDIQTTNNLISNLNGVTPEKYTFICNRFSKDRYNALTSGEININYYVSEYIEEFASDMTISSKDIVQKPGIRKTAFLIG